MRPVQIKQRQDSGLQTIFFKTDKSLFQFGFDIAERGQGVPQTGDNGLRQNIRFGQIFQIGQRRVLYPSDVQACFIARQNFIATELFKAFRFFAVIVALNKVNQIRVAQRVCDQREVHVRTQIVKPHVARLHRAFGDNLGVLVKNQLSDCMDFPIGQGENSFWLKYLAQSIEHKETGQEGFSENPLCACVKTRKHLFFSLSVVGNSADGKQSLKQTGSEP